MVDYRCSVCGKEQVKLWRPYGDDEPLICAKCAEERQSKMEYEKLDWSFDSKKNCWVGKSTGVMIPWPAWKVDENGEILDFSRDVHNENNRQKTTWLVVDISDVSPRYSFDDTVLIPAVPAEDSNRLFYSEGSADGEKALNEWWRNLPTR